MYNLTQNLLSYKYTEVCMSGIILIFLFVVLLAVPGFYVITRWVFPKGSKRNARLISYSLTALLVTILAIVMFANL